MLNLLEARFVIPESFAVVVSELTQGESIFSGPPAEVEHLIDEMALVREPIPEGLNDLPTLQEVSVRAPTDSDLAFYLESTFRRQTSSETSGPAQSKKKGSKGSRVGEGGPLGSGLNSTLLDSIDLESDFGLAFAGLGSSFHDKVDTDDAATSGSGLEPEMAACVKNLSVYLDQTMTIMMHSGTARITFLR